MRKLSVQTFLTLDGVAQAPGGSREDDSDGFTQGGWSVNYWDDRMNEVMGASIEYIDKFAGQASRAVLCGTAAKFWRLRPGARESPALF